MMSCCDVLWLFCSVLFVFFDVVAGVGSHSTLCQLLSLPELPPPSACARRVSANRDTVFDWVELSADLHFERGADREQTWQSMPADAVLLGRPAGWSPWANPPRLREVSRGVKGSHHKARNPLWLGFWRRFCLGQPGSVPEAQLAQQGLATQSWTLKTRPMRREELFRSLLGLESLGSARYFGLGPAHVSRC